MKYNQLNDHTMFKHPALQFTLLQFTQPQDGSAKKNCPGNQI